MAGNVADRLRAARRHRFVGRSSELSLFQSMITGGQPEPAVLFVHGPGGVGKTALLERFEQIAAEAGLAVVRLDGRALEPSPDAFATAVGATAPEVVLVDTYEAIESLDGWLRERYLPELPAQTRVVIAGRRPPAAQWRTDAGWRELTRAVALRNLAPAETDAFLRAEGLPQALHGRVGRLEICAHSRFTTEGLLAHALGGEDAGRLFDWLRGLSFVDSGPLGVFPHDLARDVLDADLRWRDPAGYAELHHRIRGHLVAVARQATPERQRQTCTDILFLHRTNPRIRPFIDWSSLTHSYVDRPAQDDRQAIVAMARRHEGEESAALVAYWLDRQPEAFAILRGPGHEPIGVHAQLDLHEATAADLATDPGARAMWEYTLRHGPAAPGEEVVATRFVFDSVAYQGISPTLNLYSVRGIQTVVARRRLAWAMEGGFTDPEAMAPLFADIDFHRAVGADFEVGGRRYGVFAHDFRRVPPEEWLEMTATREITTEEAPIPPPTPAALLALSEAEFADAVRQALRDLSRPDRLAHNPLRQSRVGRERESIADLLREAVATLRDNPRDERHFRALDRTYLRPAVTQEQAAQVLDLPFSTYRRYLARGIERTIAVLWAWELHGLGRN